MSNNEKRDISLSAAKIVSIIFHPILVPVYGFLIIFSAPTLFGYLSFELKKLLLMIIVVNNVFLPLSLMPFFFHRNIISSWTIEKRKDRKIPLIFATVLYATSSYIVFRFPIPFFLKAFVYSIFFLSLSATLINLWWKISLHSIASGVLIALVLMLSFKMHTSLVWYLVAVVIAGGGVLSSRLRLDYHKPLEVWIGLLTGFAGSFLFMLII